MSVPRRGDVYWLDWEPHRGSEQAGHRPGLVISGDSFNRQMRVCTVLALTTAIKPSRIAVHLPQNVFRRESMILPWQVMTASFDRFDEFMFTLEPEYMARVEDSLRLLWRF